MSSFQSNNLSSNQRFLIRELERRGVSVRSLFLEDRWLLAKLGTKTVRLFDIDGPANGYVDCLVAANKHVAKLLLAEAGISVPRGDIFSSADLQAAWEYPKTHPGTWVLKPCFGSQGNGVHTGLRTPEQLKRAYEDFSVACGADAHFLIEEQVEGVEHRVFITARGDVAITRREAAHVIGDGTSTIRQLVYTESDRRTYPKQKNSEGAIPLDEVALQFIAQQGLTPETDSRRDESCICAAIPT